MMFPSYCSNWSLTYKSIDPLSDVGPGVRMRKAETSKSGRFATQDADWLLIICTYQSPRFMEFETNKGTRNDEEVSLLSMCIVSASDQPWRVGRCSAAPRGLRCTRGPGLREILDTFLTYPEVLGLKCNVVHTYGTSSGSAHRSCSRVTSMSITHYYFSRPSDPRQNLCHLLIKPFSLRKPDRSLVTSPGPPSTSLS